MQKLPLLIWTIFVVSVAFATPVVFLCALLISTEASGNAEVSSSDAYVWMGLMLALALLLALLFIAIIREIRRLAWRWNTPAFYPLIWTVVTAPFVMSYAYILSQQPWNLETVECFGADCTTSSEFNYIALIVALVFSLFVFGPFLRSVVDLYSGLRNPRARFVSRRRRR